LQLTENAPVGILLALIQANPCQQGYVRPEIGGFRLGRFKRSPRSMTSRTDSARKAKVHRQLGEADCLLFTQALEAESSILEAESDTNDRSTRHAAENPG
jgi:hypothetical protein